MRISPLDILQQKFKVKIRGYDQDEVEAFLNLVSEDYKKANEEIIALRQAVEEQKRVSEELLAREKVLKEAIISTKKIQEQIQQNAENEASNTIRQAELMSESLMEQARAEVSKIQDEINKLKLFRKQMYMRLESEIRLLDKSILEFKEKYTEEDKVSIIGSMEQTAKAN